MKVNSTLLFRTQVHFLPKHSLESWKCMSKVFSTTKGKVSLYIFRLTFLTFVGLGQISMVLFTAFRCYFCAKDSNSPFRILIEEQISADTSFQMKESTKLLKMGPFWLVVNLEESDVEKKKKKHEFSSVLTIYCFSAMYSTFFPV